MMKWPAIVALLLLLSGASFFITLKLLEDKNPVVSEQENKGYDVWPEVVAGRDNVGCDGEWGTGRLNGCKVITIFEAGHGNVFQVRNPKLNLDKLEIVENGVKITSWNKKPARGGEVGGAFIHIGTELEGVFQNKRLLITTHYARDPVNSSKKYATVYSTYDAGTSGWKVKNVSRKSPNSNAYHHRIGGKPQRAVGDYFGVWADAEGKGGSIVITKIDVSPGS